MKNYIQTIVLFIFMVVLFFFAIKDEETKNYNIKTELKLIQDSLNLVRHDFKEHLSKCAFIDINSIQKISADGRFITLYHPAQIKRIKKYVMKRVKLKAHGLQRIEKIGDFYENPNLLKRNHPKK